MTDQSLVYIAYAHTDGADIAARLAHALSDHEIATWRTNENPGWSSVYYRKIEYMIETASHIVVCITPGANLRDSFVANEIDYALQVEKTIIPLVFSGVSYLPIRIKHYRYIDFYNWEAGLLQLLQLLKGEAGTDSDDRLPVNQRAATQEESKVFISYSRDDWTEYVAPLVKTLGDAGIAAWVDQLFLQAGEDWRDGIGQALDECDTMVLCVSPGALDSIHVKNEYRYFLDEDKRIIPVICAEAKLPHELRGLQFLQYTDVERLIELLKA